VQPLGQVRAGWPVQWYWSRYKSGSGAKLSSEFRHICYRIPGQSTVTKQYKFGISISWEGNLRSGVTLAMHHRQ